MVITGVPHFSRARALWQAIQEVPGVSEAKAINYQGGVLALEVQHDPALDLSGSVTELPGLRLRVPETAPGELRLAGRCVTQAPRSEEEAQMELLLYGRDFSTGRCACKRR